MEEQALASEDGGGANRSDILNRISKMGQSMLPGSSSGPSVSVASEEDIVSPLPEIIFKRAPFLCAQL